MSLKDVFQKDSNTKSEQTWICRHWRFKGGEGRGGHSLGPALLVRKNLKIFFYFKLKKETRRKGVNVSQLAIRNFNDVSGKHMNTPCFFIFV